jgi:predicted negative regulator of RcsB-dependent stress response
VAEHLNDEEQFEALKRWWQRSGLPMAGVLAVAAAGWFGWHWWQDRQQENAEQGAMLYGNMLQQLAAFEGGDTEAASQVSAQAQSLKALHGNSQYGRYGALVLAKLAVADQDFDGAAGELQWVLDNADDPALKRLATLRLARIEAVRGNDQAALALVQGAVAAPFAALYAELEGDIHVRQGDREAALAAYQRALDSLAPGDASARPMLELKLSQVAGAAGTDGASGEDA